MSDQPPLQTGLLERRMGDWARHWLPPVLRDAILFVLKQGWAALFGGLLLGAALLTRVLWQPGWPVHRYDALFVFAIVVQLLFLALKLETWTEARVIVLFHLTGTAMEWFKVRVGAWGYPEPCFFRVMDVPLFSGFMYASVGSYMARAIRIFDMRFIPYPPFWQTFGLALLIYVNFFSHHFIPDLRYALFMGTLAVYGRTMIHFRITQRDWWMPLPLAAFLSSVALWIAENVCTTSGIWRYAGQHGHQMVSFSKMGSWYLLLYVAFMTVTLLDRDRFYPTAKGRSANSGQRVGIWSR
ncbi:MAG: DUF817 domain-containing protein [Gluconobacter albidus]